MAYEDPLVIEVDESPYQWHNVFRVSNSSKYVSSDITAPNNGELVIRHSRGAPDKKAPNKVVGRHNIVISRKDYDATLGTHDTASVSLTVTFPDGSGVITRAELNLVLDQMASFMVDTENIDRLLRFEG